MLVPFNGLPVNASTCQTLRVRQDIPQATKNLIDPLLPGRTVVL
jgi:hypothetical protein